MSLKGDNEQKALVEFGLKVRNLRRARLLSQEDLAERAGVHRTYIGMIERGEKNVTILTLIRIATALGVRVSELTQGLDNV